MSIDTSASLAGTLGTQFLSVSVYFQEVKKVGVGISADAQKLLRDFDVQCSGIVCLAEEAGMRLENKTGRGLAGQSFASLAAFYASLFA